MQRTLCFVAASAFVIASIMSVLADRHSPRTALDLGAAVVLVWLGTRTKRA